MQKRGIIYSYATRQYLGLPNTVIRQLSDESGENMAKKKSITRISNKKRGRPKVKFSIWGLLLIFVLSFATFFVLYMLAANFNENFFDEEFGNIVVEEQNDDPSVPDNGEKTEDGDPTGKAGGLSVTNPIAQSEAKDASYFESCCIITDSTLIDMAKYTGLKDVVACDQLSAVSCNTTVIESSYGSKTAYETIQIKKPKNVYIMLGSDIGKSSVDDMIASYTELVKNLRGYLKESDIYIMQLPPVRNDDTAVSNSAINEFNTKLLTIANTNNVYCIDTNTALKGVDGMISEQYRNAETGVLTEAAYKTLADYILCHTV